MGSVSVKKSKRQQKAQKQQEMKTGIRVVDAKGGIHPYLNSAVPTKNGEKATNLYEATHANLVAPLYTSVCEVCGNAYSHLMEKHATGRKTVQCDECRWQEWAYRGEYIQFSHHVYLGFRIGKVRQEEFQQLAGKSADSILCNALGIEQSNGDGLSVVRRR